jgi:site-specific recombinase XerD
VAEVERELIRLKYSKVSLDFYRWNWHRLIRFAESRGHTYFSEQVGIDYLKHLNVLEKHANEKLSPKQVQNLRIIRMLGDFQLHGTILRRRHKHRSLLCNRYFIRILDKFREYCESRSFARTTVRYHAGVFEKFLAYIESKNIAKCKDINLKTINDFLRTMAGSSYRTVESHLYALRFFTRYLFVNNLIGEDYSTKIPSILSRKQKRIPSVWSAEDLKKLILAIDRGSPAGKRDYAIILLACRLGIRIIDIKRLTFENFDWVNKEIKFVQSKTGKPVNLPLPHDVGWAIIDYLKAGRPTVEHNHIFVKLKAPYLPLSEENHFWDIINKYIKLAHINIASKRRTGMHSLRHTLASMLLENDTPLTTISEILGHVNSDSTTVYLKVDMKKLKECPLDIIELEDLNDE